MLNNIYLYTNEAEEQNQKVKKIPHHLNKLECSFFEYLYSNEGLTKRNDCFYCYALNCGLTALK